MQVDITVINDHPKAKYKHWTVKCGGQMFSKVLIPDNGSAAEVLKHRRDFTLREGMTLEDLDKTDLEVATVLIPGHEYVIHKRGYDLSAGYAIAAWVTESGDLIPQLRRAKFQEKYIVNKRIPVIQQWPILRKL